MIRLADDLDRWCEKFGLRDSWCRDYVTREAVIAVNAKCFPDLNAQLEHQHSRRQRATTEPPRSLHPAEPAFTFEWELETETRTSFRVKIAPYRMSIDNRTYEKEAEAKVWRKFLHLYQDRGETLVGRAGEVAANFKRFRKRLDEHVDDVLRSNGYKERKTYRPDHFRWLVEYQSGGMSFTKIGENEHCTRKNVEIAVKKKAKLIDLTLRPAKRGRRPGQREGRRRHRVTRGSGI
jgi:hypothetical protein